MFNQPRRLILAFFAVIFASGAALSIAPAPSHAAQNQIYTSYFSSVAIDGHDPVAYFKQGKPVEGSKQFQHQWKGVTWLFSSAENLEIFKAAPDFYAPQYGGYCAWAVAQGNTASSDPTAWKIVNNKLYLNYSSDIQRRWEKDISNNIKRGDKNWPHVLD
ncbi:YHS domain-containing (seleno)protein [Kiloniella antarctica]|uniref:YHS domain-containing (Seleno)protein n=1 Tax=Kiloniella antarctica TaxID=1550907 RepID=A0ABW5BG59_9PROT